MEKMSDGGRCGCWRKRRRWIGNVRCACLLMKIGDRNDVIVGDEEEIEMLSKLVEIVEKDSVVRGICARYAV
jgi:hypothetical protein